MGGGERDVEEKVVLFLAAAAAKIIREIPIEFRTFGIIIMAQGWAQMDTL